MSKREKQTAFLKALVLQAAPENQQRLPERIANAERDERCSRGAFRLVLVAGLVSALGLLYLSLLSPESTGSLPRRADRCLSALLAASLASCVAFLACWLWHRALLDRLHDESRRCILSFRGLRSERGQVVGTPSTKSPQVPSRGAAELSPSASGQTGRSYWGLFSLRRTS